MATRRCARRPEVLESFMDSNGCPAERVMLGDHEVIVHYDDIPESDVTVIDGFRCTTPVRTMIDVAPDYDDATFAAAVQS